MTGTDWAVASSCAALIAFTIWFFFGTDSGRRKSSLPVDGSAHISFSIGGTHCPSCMLSIETVLSRTDGIVEVATNFDAKLASVTYSPSQITPAGIAARVA